MFWLNSRYFYCRVHYTVFHYPPTPSYWYYSLRTTPLHIRSITTWIHYSYHTTSYARLHSNTHTRCLQSRGIHTYLATHASILTTLTPLPYSACVVPFGFNTLSMHTPLPSTMTHNSSGDTHDRCRSILLRTHHIFRSIRLIHLLSSSTSTHRLLYELCTDSRTLTTYTSILRSCYLTLCSGFIHPLVIHDSHI